MVLRAAPWHNVKNTFRIQIVPCTQIERVSSKLKCHNNDTNNNMLSVHADKTINLKFGIRKIFFCLLPSNSDKKFFKF